MRIGEKRHKISIQSPATTPDAAGQETVTYTEVEAPFAYIGPLRGRERFTAQQVRSDLAARVVVRYSSNYSSIGPDWRIVYGSRTFDVLEVINRDERDRELEILVREVL